MDKLVKKLLIGGAVVAASAAAGALLYKRYMDDFYEYIVDEEGLDEIDMVDETGTTEEDFEPMEEHPTDATEE